MRLKIILSSSAVAFLLLCHEGFCASDGFSNLKCGADIPAKLIGQKMTNEPVSAIENRHMDLGLKDLGGTEITEKLFLISWRICGEEYALLEEKGIVRDVLKVPAHSKSAPLFIGSSCEIRGHESAGAVIAVLDGSKSDAKIPAKAAWKIDDISLKFVKIPTEGLLCARNGIITADGGL